MTAMAAGGRPEERAKMVGRVGMAVQVSATDRMGQGAKQNYVSALHPKQPALSTLSLPGLMP